MALSDEQILRQNRWWMDPNWQTTDPHLRRLQEQTCQLPVSLVEQLELTQPGIHTIRGPRQVGKSTAMKLTVARALASGHDRRSIIYLSVDLLQDQPIRELAGTIERAKTLARGESRQLLFLDEVTQVPNWQTAVKAAWDDGLIDRDIVVCTGSSAVDLAQGTVERLPGRRGAGNDHLLLPQAFSNFARAVDPLIPESPALSLGDLFTERGARQLEEAFLHKPAIDTAFQRYLRFGGLPAAISEAISGSIEPSWVTKRVMADSLVREVHRKGASEPALHALLERIARSLGSKTNWSQLAREMDVPLGGRAARRRVDTDYRTLRDYVELLAAGYFVMIVYFWKSDSDSNATSKDKKVYFGDPLVHTVARDLAPGLACDLPALVENVLAVALYRRYEPLERQSDSFLAPQDVHVWGTARGGEIDFVCGPRDRLEILEVKYREKVDRRSAVSLQRAFSGRPAVIASKNELYFSDHYALIPASLLLWAIS